MTHQYEQKKLSNHILSILFMAFVALMLVTACKTTSPEADVTMPEADMTDMSQNENMAGMDMNENMAGMDTEENADHDHEMAMDPFIPNDGATVKITTPADGATFKSSDTVLVTIETTGFTIGEDGNHWHVYLDGDATMVMGGNTYVLQNLSAGQHEIQVYLSNGQHENLEQGDKVTITVEE